MSAAVPQDDQLAAMEQYRGIRLASGSLYAAMHRAFALETGSEERELAMLAVDVQVRDFLSLPGNDPVVAVLAIGRIAAEVSHRSEAQLGAQLGLDEDALASRFEQHMIAAQFRTA